MSPTQALRDALLDFYEGAGRAGDAGAAVVLQSAVAELRRCGDPGPPAPHNLPVGDLLPSALAEIPGPLAAIASALRATTPHFHWRQNPNYGAANMGTAFMAGYGYVEFAGPKEALFHAPAIRLGLLVLGPGLHYPPHAHPAEEVYHPLTAGGRWRRGGEPWRDVAPGMAIHHPPMIEHETRAGSSTLLALYCWAGDTRTEARLTG